MQELRKNKSKREAPLKKTKKLKFCFIKNTNVPNQKKQV